MSRFNKQMDSSMVYSFKSSINFLIKLKNKYRSKIDQGLRENCFCFFFISTSIFWNFDLSFDLLFELFALSNDLFLSLSLSDFFSDDPLPSGQKSLEAIYITPFDFLLH